MPLSFPTFTFGVRVDMYDIEIIGGLALCIYIYIIYVYVLAYKIVHDFMYRISCPLNQTSFHGDT